MTLFRYYQIKRVRKIWKKLKFYPYKQEQGFRTDEKVGNRQEWPDRGLIKETDHKPQKWTKGSTGQRLLYKNNIDRFSITPWSPLNIIISNLCVCVTDFLFYAFNLNIFSLTDKSPAGLLDRSDWTQHNSIMF